MISQQGETPPPPAGNSAAPWKRSPSPNRAVFVQPCRSWVQGTGSMLRTAPVKALHEHAGKPWPGLTSVPTQGGFPRKPSPCPPCCLALQSHSAHKHPRKGWECRGGKRAESSGWGKS